MTDTESMGLLRSWLRHRAYLAAAVGKIVHALSRRVDLHDLSKLEDDEFAGFSRINAIARTQKFGSTEYAEAMARERATISLHFRRNRHHPERPRLMGEAAEQQRGLPDDATYWAARTSEEMSALDVIEMVCDWWAARQGYGDVRSWSECVELNLASKGQYLSDHQTWLAREIAAALEG